jgi:hypothetical protein
MCDALQCIALNTFGQTNLINDVISTLNVKTVYKCRDYSELGWKLYIMI